MPIGSNVALGDKLIKKTEPLKKADKVIRVNKVDNVDNIDKKSAERRDNATTGTVRTTFYVKRDAYKKLLNFAYWDRHNITEAVNIVLSDGLKDKTTKDTPKG